MERIGTVASSQEGDARAEPPQPRVQDAGGARWPLPEGADRLTCRQFQNIAPVQVRKWLRAYAYKHTSPLSAELGEGVHLGQFGTAVEGAVAYARHMQSLGEAPPLPPLPPPLRVLPEVTQVERNST